MAVGEVYRPGAGQGADAIVIGSGIGGLVSAALLAKSGRRVVVLERHYVAGGFTHTFRRPGYEWDVGVHYIGEVHRPGSVLRRVFDHVSGGRLAWASMGEVYDRVLVGGEAYDFVAGRRRFVDELSRRFPAERSALLAYVGRIGEAANAARGFFAEKALPPWLGGIARPFMGRAFLKHSDRTTAQVLGELGLGRELAGVLTAQWGDYGLPPGESSFAIQALVARHYLDGGNYPVGGSASIAASIAPTIERAGGTILLAAEVASVRVEAGRVKGVRLATGDTLEAPIVVSDAGVMNTLGKLLGPAPPPWAAGRLRQVRPSIAHACLYVGVLGSARELGLGKANLWVYPDYDHDRNLERFLADRSAPLPVTYISFPSAKDPDWERRYPGRTTIEALGLAPFEWFEPWQDARWRRRGKDYEALKAELSERLLESVRQHVPQVRGRIAFHELSTPLSTRHFCNYDRGEIYGIDHTPQRFRLGWLRPHTPIPGLYLTGQDIVTDGVGGALMAGVLTASAILRRNLVRDIVRRAA